MSSPKQTEGHVLVPLLAIGAMAMVLAAGFGFTGLTERADGWIAKTLSPSGGEMGGIPVWAVWVAAAVGAFGLPAAILTVPGSWRRIVLLVSAVVVMAAWAPVLVVAAREPVVAVPLLATFWAGLCAYVYAQRHHMAVDR